MPCLVTNILLDAAPLAKPVAGREANYVFWTRCTIATSIVTYELFKEINCLTPSLGMTRFHLLSTGVVVAIGCFTFDYIVAGFITMPIPFSLLTRTPMYSTTSGIMIALYCGKRLANDRALRSLSIRALGVICLQLCLTVIYPIFIYGFNSIGSHYQTVYMTLIPVIKIIAKNAMSKIVGANDDVKPEILVFNIDCFNSVYVSLAMQNATTISTAFTIMLIDVTQGCVSVYDIYQEFKVLKRMMASLSDCHPLKEATFLEVATALSACDHNHTPGDPKRHSESLTAHSTPKTSNKVLVAPISGEFLKSRGGAYNTSRNLHSLNISQRQAFLRTSRKLLFITEFVFLVEYTEVIMPIFYSMFSSL